MENSEGFKSVVAIINTIEQQLQLCNDVDALLLESSTKAEQEIEEYFAKCMNALATRKAMLMSECAFSVENQRKINEDTRIKLNDALQGCKQSAIAGQFMFNTDTKTAESVWKAMKSFEFPQVAKAVVEFKHPDDCNHILQDGKVDVEAHGYFSKVDLVTTIAVDDGKNQIKQLNYPQSFCHNPKDDCMYVCDYGSDSIKKVTLQGEISTFVQGLRGPSSIVKNYKDSHFYVTDQDSHTIVRISPIGEASIFVGNGNAGFVDGIGTNSSFGCPFGIAIDQATGTLYVSDEGTNSIRKITYNGEVTTLAGSREKGFADGIGKNARFSSPRGLYFDDIDQSLLVCDWDNNRIRRVSQNGEVSTVCEVQRPYSVTITSNRTIFVSSIDQNYICKIIKQGGNYEVNQVVGSEEEERVDGTAENCSLSQPVGLVVHEPSHSLFFSEFKGQAIRKISFL